MRFAIVPENLINMNDPVRLQTYCRIYLSVVLSQSVNCRAISQETGLSYGIVYRLKRQAEEMLSKAVRKPTKKSVKTSRKVNDNSNAYNAVGDDMSDNTNDNSVKSSENSVKSRRKPGSYTARHDGILRLVLEEEEEKEEKLLTLEEILELPPSEREVYIQQHQQQLKQQGVI